ncbi:DUF6069 family protein [Cryptosporangium sp. NPDC048952]|uniref:DUF6069 family protein n=1 Tax=Cryptosporangium sp. NPDC048952 TaxID=3363961 RepID=UPI0037119546
MTSAVSARTGYARVVTTGLLAAVGAVAATTLVAAALNVDLVGFEGETIPLSGLAVVTGFFSLVGVVIAVVLLRLSARPARTFVRTALVLTAISLVPPLFTGGSAVALVGLHLLAAAVVIPALAWSLRA